MARTEPRMHWANVLIGGGTGALDKIDGSTLIDLDGACVVTTANCYLYILDADSATAESSPSVISPDSNAGDKRWILTSVATKTLIFADGGAVVTQVKDEDDMAADSATMLATQQSIKKYVDTATAGASGFVGGLLLGGM